MTPGTHMKSKLPFPLLDTPAALASCNGWTEEVYRDLLALQQPVAGDLRFVVAALRMSTTLERMGDLAEHVAGVARRRYPASAIPAELRSTILEMGQVAERIVQKAGSVIASHDVQTALELDRRDLGARR